jgi:hypothetical protein
MAIFYQVSRLKPQKTDFPFGVFDIETEGLNAKKFKFGVVKVNKKHHIFTDRVEMLNFMLSYEGYSFFAHNSEYDLSGLFENIIGDLNYPDDSIVYSGSSLIQLSKCVKKTKVGKQQKIKRVYVNFLDSMNYFKTSLGALGDAIGIKKLKEIVDFEKMEVNSINVKYCKRDCDILEKALEYFFDVLKSFGVRPRLTIAGNALALFRTAFLKQDYKINIEYDKYFLESYFGGRTETFKNWSYNGYCYDFNSLYPSVMQKGYRYPNPQMLRQSEGLEVLMSLLNNKYYEGVAEVTVKFSGNIPLLPYRQDGKLYFPQSENGTLKGFWNFPELREALESGYEFLECGKIIYSKGIDSPFGDYVKTLYELRQKYKSEGSCMELFVKYLLNSLYGKFGQQNEKREIGSADEILQRENQIFEEFTNAPGIGYWKTVDTEGNIQKSRATHSCFAWCSYVTSYARVKLFRAFKEANFNVAYCDTDSIFTTEKMNSSKELGDLKLEYAYTVGHFIKAKHYRVTKLGNYQSEQFITYDNSVKIKGVRNPENENITTQEVKKVMKNKEALKVQRINPSTGKKYKSGEPITIKKIISLQDEKRKWENGNSKPYDIDELKVKKGEIQVNLGG